MTTADASHAARAAHAADGFAERQWNQRRRGPGLAAEILQIAREQEARSRHVYRAHHPKDVGSMFGSRPRALVWSLGSRPNMSGGDPTVLTCAPAAVVPLDGCNP